MLVLVFKAPWIREVLLLLNWLGASEGFSEALSSCMEHQSPSRSAAAAVEQGRQPVSPILWSAPEQQSCMQAQQEAQPRGCSWVLPRLQRGCWMPCIAGSCQTLCGSGLISASCCALSAYVCLLCGSFATSQAFWCQLVVCCFFFSWCYFQFLWFPVVSGWVGICFAHLNPISEKIVLEINHWIY